MNARWDGTARKPSHQCFSTIRRSASGLRLLLHSATLVAAACTDLALSLSSDCTVCSAILMMDDFNSETDSDYTSYWRDWVRVGHDFCANSR